MAYKHKSQDAAPKMVKQTSKAISIFEEGSTTFYLSGPKHRRASSTHPPKQVAEGHQIRSPVQFDKQTPRVDICKTCPDVNEKRFLTYDTSPPTLTSTKRVPSPSFSLSQGRKVNVMYQSLEDQPQYDPSYSSVWKSTGLVAFNKQLGRKHDRPASTDLTRDIDYSYVDRKLRIPLLGKSAPKPADPNLPAFMIGMVTRGSTITQKTLEMNCYQTNDFLPLKSTFGSGWKQNNKILPQPIKGKCPKIVKLLMKSLAS